MKVPSWPPSWPDHLRAESTLDVQDPEDRSGDSAPDTASLVGGCGQARTCM